MPNNLSNETSPYLRQHENNPVDWYPWSKEALQKAKQENKPIFLSIGYAACHWCHVMAHESFEDVQIAQILNSHFISIKVDREERPDLDDIYMQSVVLLTGQGGWPMSVFLTPDLKPFYGGTYFPPEARFGLPSFRQVLLSIIDIWKKDQNKLKQNAQSLTEAIYQQQTSKNERQVFLDLKSVVKSLYDAYDWENGGWGPAPKFPQPMIIEFLIQRGLTINQQSKRLVEHLLEKMARGGMYDLIGGGFHRYSTDQNWLIPHFEKMLYDNAQLALAYLHGFTLTDNDYFRYVAVDTLNFIQRELEAPQGGFYSSLDADTSEGEGRYYTWQLQELKQILTQVQAQQLQDLIHLTTEGNYEENLNILQFKTTFNQLAANNNISVSRLFSQVQPIFQQLRHHREHRVPPDRDEKIITGWNAMAIIAFVQAGIFLGREDFINLARKAMFFILSELETSDGYLKRSWSQGKASHPAMLSDYAWMILACQALYEVDFSPDLFNAMRRFYQTINQEFSSTDDLYFDSGATVSDLIVSPQRLQDNAIPSGNALTAHVHWLFGNYEHNPAEFTKSSNMVAAISKDAKKYPTGYGHWLRVADLNTQIASQIVLVSDKDKNSLTPFLSLYRQTYRPYSVITAKTSSNLPDDELPEMLTDRPAIDGKPTAYVCHNFSCKKPITNPKEFQELLEKQPPHDKPARETHP